MLAKGLEVFGHERQQQGGDRGAGRGMIFMGNWDEFRVSGMSVWVEWGGDKRPVMKLGRWMGSGFYPGRDDQW